MLNVINTYSTVSICLVNGEEQQERNRAADEERKRKADEKKLKARSTFSKPGEWHVHHYFSERSLWLVS